jgi:hypothetical protein
VINRALKAAGIIKNYAPRKALIGGTSFRAEMHPCPRRKAVPAVCEGRSKLRAYYRYYVATTLLRSGVPSTCPIRRIPAIEIEAAVVGQIKLTVQSSEIVVATWRAAKSQIKGLSERQVRNHFQSFDEIWSELCPSEQARIVRLLVARVDVTPDGADVTLRTDGLARLMQDLRTPDRSEQAA